MTRCRVPAGDRRRAALDAAGQGGPSDGRVGMLRAADDYARTFDPVPVHLVVCVALDALAVTDAALDRPSVIGGSSIYPYDDRYGEPWD